ncbi:MAG TPA: TRAP transporter small permease [Dehalococcoidales bacterium]|nr:TRAP transporter small permease [Dehalococcoidales bacterium]
MKFTTWLEKFEKFNRRLSGWFEWIGIAGLLVMMLVTGIDVVGAKVFTWRLLGAIDTVMLAQIVAIAFAAATALIVGRHVKVEFFVSKLPKRVQAVIDSIIYTLGLGLFVLIIWRLTKLGYSFQTSGEATATVYIPLYPLAYGIALASIPVCFVFLVELIKSLTRMVKR